MNGFSSFLSAARKCRGMNSGQLDNIETDPVQQTLSENHAKESWLLCGLTCRVRRTLGENKKPKFNDPLASWKHDHPIRCPFSWIRRTFLRSIKLLIIIRISLSFSFSFLKFEIQTKRASFEVEKRKRIHISRCFSWPKLSGQESGRYTLGVLHWKYCQDNILLYRCWLLLLTVWSYKPDGNCTLALCSCLPKIVIRCLFEVRVPRCVCV